MDQGTYELPALILGWRHLPGDHTPPVDLDNRYTGQFEAFRMRPCRAVMFSASGSESAVAGIFFCAYFSDPPIFVSVATGRVWQIEEVYAWAGVPMAAQKAA